MLKKILLTDGFVLIANPLLVTPSMHNPGMLRIQDPQATITSLVEYPGKWPAKVSLLRNWYDERFPNNLGWDI